VRARHARPGNARDTRTAAEQARRAGTRDAHAPARRRYAPGTAWRREEHGMDDKGNRGGGDRDRINIHEAFEVQYWTDQLGVTEAQLKEAVERVGVMAADVRRALAGDA
jgi:hypothetical protein